MLPRALLLTFARRTASRGRAAITQARRQRAAPVKSRWHCTGTGYDRGKARRNRGRRWRRWRAHRRRGWRRLISRRRLVRRRLVRTGRRTQIVQDAAESQKIDVERVSAIVEVAVRAARTAFLIVLRLRVADLRGRDHDIGSG